MDPSTAMVVCHRAYVPCASSLVVSVFRSEVHPATDTLHPFEHLLASSAIRAGTAFSQQAFSLFDNELVLDVRSVVLQVDGWDALA